MKIDISALLAAIDVKKVLTDIGVPYKERRGGTEIQLRCVSPTHADNSGDSLHMNARGDTWNGAFKCVSCGLKGSFIKYLENATQNTFKEILDFLKNYGPSIARSTIDDVIKLREIPDVKEEEKKLELQPININYSRFQYKPMWDLSDFYESYMSSRMIHPMIAFKYGVGYSRLFMISETFAVSDAIVFPISYKGQIVTYFLRCCNGNFYKDTCKLFPPSSPVAYFCYDIDVCDNGKDTIIVEGIIDKLVVESALLTVNCRDYNVISVYSNCPSSFHIEQIRKIPGNIIFMPDRDNERGTVLCERIGREIVHSKEVSIANIQCGKDPGGSTYPEILQAIHEKENWSEHISRNKLLYGTPYLYR